jgi:DNA repair protein RecN (Recombination protein N)
MLDLQDRIDRLRIDDREKERKIDILKYSINEIESAEINEGEDEELEREYRVLKNYEELVSAAGATHDFLKAGESSALPLLDEAIAELSKIKEFSSDIGAILDNLETAKISVEECAYSLQSYIEGIAYEPGKIDRILSRIELIKSLKKKYGQTVQEIKEYGDKCEQELLSLESNEKTIRELDTQLLQERNRAHKFAIALSAQRRVSAKTLEESIMKELSYLSMGKARFSVSLTYKESDNGTVNIDGKSYELFAHGLDRVEFMITTNVGEPLMPLKNVASGGELSRIMLAIKTVLGNVDPIRTFVFDEVDAGIGGKVSWAVGNRLKELSGLKQILCVTHQAQIASRGDLNVRVDKLNRDGRTFTAVKVLGGREKAEEIARMISGKTISETALKQAYEMIRET